MGGRAVEGTGLENRQARKGLVGSNPTPSARTAFAVVRGHSPFTGKPKVFYAIFIRLPPLTFASNQRTLVERHVA